MIRLWNKNEGIIVLKGDPITLSKLCIINNNQTIKLYIKKTYLNNSWHAYIEKNKYLWNIINILGKIFMKQRQRGRVSQSANWARKSKNQPVNWLVRRVSQSTGWWEEWDSQLAGWEEWASRHKYSTGIH